MARRGSHRPFASGAVLARLNTLLRADEYPTLNGAELGLLRALISLADWSTGVIPYSAEQVAAVARVHRDTVSRMRTKLCAAGLLVVRWRTSTQVQYGLADVLRDRV